MSHRSDPVLIEACLRGERAAWEALVGRYARLVWSVARKQGLSSGDADDVHQVVFATLIGHLAELRDRERLSSWLITTTSREAWRTRQRLRRRVEVQTGGAASIPPAADEDDAAGPAAGADEEDRQLVREAMGHLNERCRDLLTALFAAGGEPRYPEIAERLGMPVGSIGPTRARCLAKLESLLRSLGLGEGRG